MGHTEYGELIQQGRAAM